jgi:hypothetical protein
VGKAAARGKKEGNSILPLGVSLPWKEQSIRNIKVVGND